MRHSVIQAVPEQYNCKIMALIFPCKCTPEHVSLVRVWWSWLSLAVLICRGAVYKFTRDMQSSKDHTTTYLPMTITRIRNCKRNLQCVHIEARTAVNPRMSHRRSQTHIRITCSCIKYQQNRHTRIYHLPTPKLPTHHQYKLYPHVCPCLRNTIVLNDQYVEKGSNPMHSMTLDYLIATHPLTIHTGYFEVSQKNMVIES